MTVSSARTPSSARTNEPPPSAGAVRVAVALAMTLLLFGPSALVARGFLRSAGLWPGWLTLCVVLLPVLFVASRAATAIVDVAWQDRLLRILTAVVLGGLAAGGLWLALADLWDAFGLDLATAFRLGIVGCGVVSIAVAVLAALGRLPGWASSVLAVELAVLTFAVVTVGTISLGGPLLGWLSIPVSWPFKFVCAALGCGVVGFLASRRFFEAETRSTLQFASRWLSAAVAALFVTSSVVFLWFAVELRLLSLDERIVLSVNRGIGIFALAMVCWLLVLRRFPLGVAWTGAAVAAIASVYLAFDTDADRRELWRVGEQRRSAAFAYREQNFDDALWRWQEVLEVRERLLPGEHELVAEAHAGVGATLYELGRPEAAVAPLSRALELSDSGSMESMIEKELIRARLAVSLQQLGRFREANRHLAAFDDSALSEMSSSRWEFSELVARVADVYRRSGRLGEAERLYRSAIEAFDLSQGRNWDALFRAKSGLVKVLIASGRYDDARGIVDELHRLMMHAWRPLHMADTYRLEAQIESADGKRSAAIAAQRQGLSRRVEHLGRDHPDTAVALRELGIYFMQARRYSEALTACAGAREILIARFGSDTPEVIETEYALACVYLAAGRHAEAARILEHCLERWQSLYGDDYILMSEARHLLANALAREGNHRRSAELFFQAQAADLDHFQSLLSVLSERQQVAALQRLRARAAEVMLHTARHAGAGAHEVRRTLDGWLRIKGALLETQRSRSEMLALDPSEETRELAEQLRAIDNELAVLWFEGRSDRRGREAIQRLREERSEIEKDLHQKLTESGFWTGGVDFTTRELEDRLPPGSAYVDFCRAGQVGGEDRYLVFVVPAGSAGPLLVDLGPATEIDGVVFEYLAAIARGFDQTTAGRNLGSRVFDLLVGPWSTTTTGIEWLLVSPDGALARLPFGCMRDRSGAYLDEEFRISYLSNGRDLALWDGPQLRKRSAIVVADPDFDTMPPKPPDESRWVVERRGSRRRAWGIAPFQNVHLGRLPGTRREADAVVRLLEDRTSLDVLVFTDLDANEGAMDFVESPWLMHFATHGYSIPGELPANPSNLTPLLLSEYSGLRAVPEDNPLARAGLALAGANEAFRRRDEWGLLTLDEIISMPLVDTEMVVVSACNSGIGEVREGEGVFGVGRAFLAAGSRSVVVTLWSVADEPTAELMEIFYSRWLAGETKAEALRQARSEIRRVYPSAMIWAPFVLVGDPS